MGDRLLKGVLYEQALVYARQLWRYKWLSIAVAWLVCVIGWPVVSLIPPKYEVLGARLCQRRSISDAAAAGAGDGCRSAPAGRVSAAHPAEPAQSRTGDPSQQPRPLALRQDQRKGRARRSCCSWRRTSTLASQGPNLVKITYQNPNPTVAKDVVQGLLTVFAENTTGGNRREMDNAKRFLDQQIETYAAQLRAAEQRRAEFHEKYLQLLPGADGAASHLEAGRAVVARLKLELEDARAKRDSLKTEFDATPKIISVDSNAPQVIIAEKTAVGLARGWRRHAPDCEELSTRYTPAHPDMIALRRQIARLEAEAKKEPADAADGSVQEDGRKAEIANPVYEKVKLSLVDAEMALASAQRRLQELREAAGRTRRDGKGRTGSAGAGAGPRSRLHCKEEEFRRTAGAPRTGSPRRSRRHDRRKNAVPRH